MNSELHGVNLIVSGKREACAHVLHDAWGLVCLQVLHQGVVDGLLESSAFGGTGLLLVFVEYVSTFGFGGLVLECSVSDLGDIGSSSLYLSARRDGVNLVDALERDAVHFEGTTHEEETGLELLEEDNSLSAITAGGKDENASFLDALAELGCTSYLSAGLTCLVLCRVPIEILDH